MEKKVSDMSPKELEAHNKARQEAFKAEHGYNLEDETGKQKFERIYANRLRKAIKAIDALGNCANPGYEYDPKVVNTATTYLHNQLDNVWARFTPKTAEAKKADATVEDIISGKISVESEEPEADQE